MRSWFGSGGGCVGRRRLRRQRVQTMRRQGRDHHEDDQQHQQHVDQRRHVDVRFRPGAGPPTFIDITILLELFLKKLTGVAGFLLRTFLRKLLGDQADLIHARRAQIVHHVFDGLILGARIRA